MKKLLLIFTLLFSVMFSTTSFAEWVKITETIDGNEFFVEKSSIKKNNGYVYYWYTTNYLKPTDGGHLSSKILRQLDCNVPRKQKMLSATFYTGPMSTGNFMQIPQDLMNIQDWEFYPPGATMTSVMDYVCSFY